MREKFKKETISLSDDITEINLSDVTNFDDANKFRVTKNNDIVYLNYIKN